MIWSASWRSGLASSTVAPRSANRLAAASVSLPYLVVDVQQAAEVGRPGDAPALDVALGGAGERRARLGDRDRHSVVGAGHHREHQRGVSNGPGHRAVDAKRVVDPRRGVGRDAAGADPEADDVAVGGRVAERAAVIAALGQGAHAGRQGDGRSAARPAGVEVQVPGVQGLPEDRVAGVAAGRELGRVGLADDDPAGLLQPGHEECVDVWHVVLVQLRAVGGAQAGRLGHVLEADRQAVERAELVAAHDGRLGRLGQ